MQSLPIILLVVATALAVPLPTDKTWPPVEEITCTNSRFQVNTIYQYKYEAFSLTNVDGTSDKGTGLRYRCDVQASVPEPCKLVVNVEDCALRHLDDIEEQTKLPRHDASKDFNHAISQYDIIAHVDEGIVKKVLAHPEEPRDILNIKRGILNMISLNFEEGTEEIVERRTPCLSGNCTQLRRVVDSRDGHETDVEITRDLRQCENRPISGLWTSPLVWNVTLYDKLITSNQTCTYELEWDIIKRVKCSEFHTFWPFSYDSTRGIKMEVFQDLKYSDKEKVNSVTPVNEESRRVTDLIFEHEEEEEMKVTDPTYANEILKKLVKGSLEEIQMDTPQLFSQFVGAIRKLSNESIHELYERAINCPLYYESCQNNEVKVNLIKTFVYDALVQCGTLECFRVVNTAIISGEVSKPLADFVMYTMALRDYPELTLIEETLRVAFYERTQSTFLPLSIMINNYWNNNEEALMSERRLPEEIHSAIAFLSSIIGYDCSMPSNAIDGGETIEHQRQVFLALKAIGNIGQPALHYDSSHYLVDEMMATRLVKCAENKDIPRNISLAAVQAMRRFDISQDIRDPLKRILMKTDEDVELRMVSYLMIMRSQPQEIDIADILYMLSEEPIDQVRAFIYSHLDNILESDLDTVQELKNTILVALRGEHLPEYPKDIRRLSRNIELSKVLNISQFDGIVSYLNETFGYKMFDNTVAQFLNMDKTIGGGMEMNTIYNPETYMMRAMMMKTTLNLLGKEWEMIETGIDMQGFEPTLEAIFGPQGFFPDSLLEGIIKTVDEKFIQVLRDLYNSVEPHVMDVVNAPVAEMPDVLTNKAKETTDYLYDSYSKMNTKQKRSITDDLSQRITELTNLLPGSIHENIQTIHETVSKMPLSPSASIYLRFLGHEVGFVTLDDVVRMVPKVNLTKDGLMEMAMKMVQKAQNGMEYNITKSFVFMDTEFVLPTSLGLPVRCNVNGTTSVSLRLRGQVGLQLPKIVVAGRIAPSAAVNFVGAMTTELPGFTKHAVMANATMYHASRFEGNITVDGTHIKVNLNNTTPITLLNFTTNFYLMDLNGDLSYVHGIQQDRVEKEMCVPEALTQPIFGMTPCVSWAYPNASYAEMAPRFPLTGPSSFNVTLRNIDPELKTFTWEVAYKQIKPTATKNIMRRRRSTTEPKVNIIDTLVLKFSAPGKDRKREISSVASFDRSKTEFRYNFSIPEANVTFFSGLMNKTCSKSMVSGFQFVSNFTALRPEYNGSISLTLMNSTVTDKNNYTVAYNMSLMDLYSSVVAEYVQTPSFLIASTNVTYYWDNETPLWNQVMWPMNNYTINPAKYRQDYVMIKSEKRETSKNIERDSILKVSVMNQNFTVKSDIVKDDIYYNNEIQADFENSYNTMRIINVTAKSERRETKQSIKVTAERFGHGVFVQWDRKQDSTDSNHTLTYGYQGDKKEILESFKVFQNQPSVMAWFEDDAYSVQHISYNISHTLCLRDESIADSVNQRLVYFNTSFPKPLTSERLNFSLSARVANESMRADNNRSYWMEFNTSVPFLWFHNAQRVQFTDGVEGIDLRYNNTMTELYSNRKISFDDRFTYLWKTMNATMEMNVKSCYFNYTFNTTMYNSTESGYVFDYSSVQNNTLLHLFNITHGGNFSIAPRNISLIGAFWHPWMQVNMTNVLYKHGPITRFSLANIRAISVDIKEKAQILDVTGIKIVLMELIDNTLDSSFNLTNLITVRTPWLGNMTLDHTTHFNFSIINHTMNVEVIRPRSNVGFLLNTSALLNRTRLSGAYNASLIGNRFYNGTSNMSFVLRKADEGALAIDFVNNHGFVTPFGKMNMNGTYNIHNMTRPWRFNVINGTLGYDVNTRLVNSTMNSSFIMDNFSNLFKFDGIRADLDHNITSRWMKWIANGSFIVDDFRNPVNYSRINGGLTTNFTSCVANMTHNVAMDVKNMSGIFRFEKIGGNITQNVDSIFGKSVFNTSMNLVDVTSPWNFNKINGGIDYNLTSRFANLTMSNMMKFKSFTKLWEFEKIKGLMVWSLNTSLANATLKHGVDFDNFITPINFDRVNFTLEHEVNSKLTNASLKQAYGMYGMRSYLTFDRANSSIKGEVRTPWINSSMEHVMDIQTMAGPFNMAFANVSLAARTVNRFLNFTTNNGMEWNNMQGIFSFERINGNHDMNISTPVGMYNTFGELVFDTFTNLTNFRMVNATGLINANSRFLNFTTRVGHEMHNFRSLFDFDRVQTDERTTVRNCLMNHTGETHLTFDTFRSMFDFNSINGNLDAKTSTFLGEHNQTYTFDLRNSRQLFAFDRLYANAQVDTKSRLFNMTATHNLDLNRFEKLFTFSSATLNSNIDIKTPIMNTTHEVRFADNDHREMFFFSRIFGGHIWTVDTPIHSFVTDSDIEMLYFYKMFEFTHLHVNNAMELTNRFVNFTNQHKAHFDGFRSAFDFNQISTGGTTELSTILGNHNSNIDITFNQFRSLLNFDSIKGLGESHFVSRYLNDSVVLRSAVTNHRDLLDYDRFDGSYNMLFHTKWYNLTQNAGFGVDMMRKLFNFDRISTGASMNMTTPIVSAGSRAGIEFENFRSLLNYERINASTAMNMTSRWMNVTTEATHGIHEMSRMFVFERMNTTGVLNISTPIINSNTSLGLDMFNFTKLWRFTRVNGSALWNVNSRWLNITNEGMFGIHNVVTPWRFERINGTAKMNVSTPIVNTTGMVGVEFNNFTNLLNFSRINGTGNWNVSNRFLNFTTLGEFGLHNFSSIFTFERMNGSARMNLSTPLFVQSGDVGLELNSFDKLWQFRRINGSGNLNVSSRYLNMTTGGDFGFHNFDWFTTFERINGGVRMNVSTPFFRQASMAGIEFNDFTNLTNFRRVNATTNMTVGSRFLNMTSQAEIGFHNFQSLFTFDRINTSTTIDMSTPIVNVSVITGSEHTNFMSLFNFDLINMNHTVSVKSKIANFTCEGALGFNDFASFSVFRLINGFEKMNFSSKYVNMTTSHAFEDKAHTAFFAFERFNVTSLFNMTSPFHRFTTNTTFAMHNCNSILDFENVDVNMITEFVNRWMNITTNSSIALHEFKSLFEFERADVNMTSEIVNRLMNVTTNSSIAFREFKSLFDFNMVNSTFVANITTPVATTKLNASLLLSDVTSWRLHNIKGSVVFLFRSPMLNSSILTQMNMTNFLTVSQMIQMDNRVRIMEKEAGLVLTEKINNDFVLFNVTIPETGSLCALAELNKVGDLLNMSLFRQTTENVNITDLSWVLMMNRSDVVYSKFTWNPETLRAIRTLSGEAFNKTINVTLTALNKTRDTINNTLTVARRAINSTIQAVNFTYNNPIESLKIVINGSLVDATIVRLDATKLFLNQTMNATIFYVNQTYYLMDFTSVNTTVETFVEAIKQTPLNVPIQFVNETVRRMDFTTVNSTIDSILREINCAKTTKTVITLIKHLNNSIEIIGNKMNETLVFLNTTSTKAIILFNQKLNETISFLNETWREGNFTTLNATIETIVSALNRTRLNTTIIFIDNTWQQMNFTSLNSTVESLKTVVNFTAINATIQRLVEKVNFTQINETVFEMLKMVNLTHLNKTVMEYTNLVITEIQRIAKNESHPVNLFTIKHLNTTAYNLTMKAYPVVMNLTDKYYPVVRNFTLHYYYIGQNLTDKYYPVVYNFTVTYYPQVVNYTVFAYNKTKNFTCVAMNFTRVYGEVLYNRSLIVFNRTANFTDRALNLTTHYGLVAFNKTRNYTLWLVNVTRPQRELAYNFTLNMTNLALNKAVNYSLQVIEYTANKTEWAKENHREYIIYYIEVLNNMTNKSSNMSGRVFKITEKAAKKAIDFIVKYGTPLAEKALERSKNASCYINYFPMKYYQKTLYVLGSELKENVVRKALEIVLKEDSTLNVYLEKITEMNAVEFGMFVRAKAIEYNGFIHGNATYFAEVTRSNVTFWTNYTLENAPMVALNLIGNITIKANDTVLWLNGTRSQTLNATLEEVKAYLNETVIELVDFLNKTLNGSTERLLNMTWAGYNMTIQYANRTLIYVNETACYVRNTTVKVWRFINEETPLVNMTIDFANKTLNFTLTYVNKTMEITLQYAKKGKNASLIAFDYLKNKTEAIKNYTVTKVQDMDFEYIYFVANYTKNVTQWSIDYTKDYAKMGVEYVNGTMVGWFIRYYDIHRIPYNLYNITYTQVNNTPEYLRKMVEFNKRLTLDTINRIGRLEDNSFAINVSHPLNITSFRKLPNLTDNQWEVINNVTGRVKIYACKAREYVDLLREIAEEKYTEAREYVMEVYEEQKPMIDERINQVKAKYEELKVKVQELRERIPEYREVVMEKYEIFKTNWPTYKQQIKDKVQNITEQIPTWEEIKEIPAQIKEEIDAIIAEWPETYMELRTQIIALPGKYLELKSKINTWVEQLEFDIPMECQKLMDKTVEYPRINAEIEKICYKIPELRLDAEEKYEEVQRYIEIARVYVEQKLELVCEKKPIECEQIKQYWQTISEIDAPFVTEKLQEYIPETWDQAKQEATEQWQILKQKIDELKVEAEVKIEELKVKVEELKVQALEMKDELKEKAIEIRDLIKQEYPNAKEHIKFAIEQIKNMIEGTYNEIRNKLVDFLEANYPTLKMYVEDIVNDILAYIIGLQPVLDKEATAMIFGNLGVMTFDKKLYEFPGYRDPSCTYVLARDFADKNFTLLADQNALTAVFPSVVVKINDEHKVFINGVPEHKELPYQTPDREVKVVREGPWVNVTTKYGITINCHEKNFLCTMKLSSWYHGKTQGLLGTFDREIHNEMRKIDNTNATTIVEWVNNYEVTGHTYCQIPPGRNVFPTLSGICDEPAASKISVCESLFMDPQSQFAEAFNMIDNGPFFEMCNHMARDCRDICEVAHGYVSVCRDEGIMIEHTPLCDRCENEVELDTKFNITKIPANTADIVLVVSENHVMDESRRAKTYINDLIAKADKTLRKAGIEDNLYSVVAFGGEGVHKDAHQHTSNGKIWATKDELYSGVESLEFDGQYQTDGLSALEFANNLHWRPESTRMIILITEAERMEPFNTTLTYQDLAIRLEDNSVRLFVFSEYETLNKDGIEPVLGINFDSTLVTIKKTSADDSTKLKLPKGNYAKIATATRGGMFRINMLLSDDFDRSEFNAQISKVVRNTIEGEYDSVNYKSCMCALDLHQCPATECKTIRK